jgi:AcrR family transcriptional regulator
MILDLEKQVQAASLRAPLQERSRKTLDRIVRAAREIAETEGADAVTVQSVAARSKASVGSFYARFRGKEDLLLHIEKLAWAELNTAWTAETASIPASGATVPAAVEKFVEILSRTWSRGRAERRGYGPRWGPRERAFALQVRSAARELLIPLARQMRHPNPALAVDLGARAVLAVLDAADDHEATSEPLVRELARLYVGYLTVPSEGDAPGDGPVDYFDVWG